MRGRVGDEDDHARGFTTPFQLGKARGHGRGDRFWAVATTGSLARQLESAGCNPPVSPRR